MASSPRRRRRCSPAPSPTTEGARVRSPGGAPSWRAVTLYGLPNHLGVCEVDGRMLMLDLKRDRYLQLDRASAAAFRQWRRDPMDLAGVTAAAWLVERGMLVPAASPQLCGRPPASAPHRSLADSPRPPSRSPLRLLPEVAALLFLTRWRL